jgi:hypothetical protein
MPNNFTDTDKLVAKVLVAIGALIGIGVAVFFSEVVFAYSCEAPDTCERLSDPVKTRVSVWLLAIAIFLAILFALFGQRLQLWQPSWRPPSSS